MHIPPHLLPELRAHLEDHRNHPTLVFTTGLGGPLSRGGFRSTWVKAREHAGLPDFRFHDLRHTGNTLAATTGASAKELMARMGHASMRAALIYQHATAERDQSIAKALSRLAAGEPGSMHGSPPVGGHEQARPLATGGGHDQPA